MNADYRSGVQPRAIRSGLALLLVAAAATGCETDGPVTSPGDISSDPPARELVTTAAAPEEGTFAVEVRLPFEGQACSPEGTELIASGDPATYTVPSGVHIVCIVAKLTSPPNAGGSLKLSECVIGKNTKSSITACTERGGGGHWGGGRARPSPDGQWETPFPAFPGVTRGVRLQYRGMGNGVKNTTLPLFDVTRPVS